MSLYYVGVWRPQRPEELDSCELLCGCWKLNLGPLEEQPVLWTAEPSVQSNSIDIFFFGFLWQGFSEHRHFELELLKLSFSMETGEWCCQFPSTVTVNLGCFILAEGFRTWLLVLVAFLSWGNSPLLCHTHHVIMSLWSEVRPCLPHSWEEAKKNRKQSGS